MRSGIYKISCVNTGKYYIGSSVDCRARWSMHRHLLKRGRHSSMHLQRAWIKHGAESFVFEVIENVAVDALIQREQFYLDTMKPFGRHGYNISPTAGGTRGAKRTRDQIEHMASFHRGKVLSAEHRRALSEAGKGRKHSAATKRKMRDARLLNNHQVGRPMTERQRAALCKRGQAHPWWGRTHSDASRRKISLAKSCAIEQLDDAGRVIARWDAARNAARALGLRWPDTILRALNNPNRRAANFYWRRVQDRVIVS